MNQLNNSSLLQWAHTDSDAGIIQNKTAAHGTHIAKSQSRSTRGHAIRALGQRKASVAAHTWVDGVPLLARLPRSQRHSIPQIWCSALPTSPQPPESQRHTSQGSRVHSKNPGAWTFRAPAGRPGPRKVILSRGRPAGTAEGYFFRGWI